MSTAARRQGHEGAIGCAIALGSLCVSSHLRHDARCPPRTHAVKRVYPCTPSGRQQESIAGVCRNDGHYRRDRGCKDHEARDRGPHELRREVLSERARDHRSATRAPDCQEHRSEHAGRNQRAHAQNHESHTLHSLGARKGRCRSRARLQASLTSVRSNLRGPLQSLVAQDSRLAHRFANNGSNLLVRRLRAHRRDKDRLRRCGLTRPLS